MYVSKFATFSILTPFLLVTRSFAIILPPLGVFLERGCNTEFVGVFLYSLRYESHPTSLVYQHYSRKFIYTHALLHSVADTMSTRPFLVICTSLRRPFSLLFPLNVLLSLSPGIIYGLRFSYLCDVIPLTFAAARYIILKF